jgi:hypothetical protein
MTTVNAELEAWLGVPDDSLQIVYLFNGIASRDSRMGVTDHWTQRHNPYLGKSIPDVLAERPPSSVGVFYAKSFMNPTIGCLVLTAAPPSAGEGDDFLTRFWRSLKASFAAADMLALLTPGLIGDEVPCHFAIRLAPNTFSLDVPYTCCEGHAIISYVAAVVSERGSSDGLSMWFKSALRDRALASTHSHFFDHSGGRKFRKLMLPLHTVVLSDTLRRVARNKQSSSWNSEVLGVFAASPASSLRKFFSTEYLVYKLFSFYETWYDNEPRHGDAITRNLRSMLFDVVPFDLRGGVLQTVHIGLADWLDAYQLHETLFSTLVRCMLQHNDAVWTVLSAALGKCWFAVGLVSEFSGLPVSRGVIALAVEACVEQLNAWFWCAPALNAAHDRFLVDLEALYDDFPAVFTRKELCTPTRPFDVTVPHIAERLRLLRLNVSPLQYFHPRCLLTHRHDPDAVWTEANENFEEYMLQLVLEGVRAWDDADAALEGLATFLSEFSVVLPTHSVAFQLVECLQGSAEAKRLRVL